MNELNIENINFYSEILNKNMGINVYIPKEYKNDNTSLPVLYFLHGRSGNENIIFDLKIAQKADKMIKENKIRPLIIVCPRIENSRGINSASKCRKVLSSNKITINVGMYEDYLIKEVIPLIDKKFNTIKSRNARYIGGASAGGYAALHNLFRHQDIFSKAGGHMPAIELNLEDEDKPYFPTQSVWEKYDPITIAKTNDISSDIKVYLDSGDKDEGHFYDGCKTLHDILSKKEISCENHIYNGRITRVL